MSDSLFGGGKRKQGSALARRLQTLREQKRDAEWLAELVDRVEKLEAQVAKLKCSEDATKDVPPQPPGYAHPSGHSHHLATGPDVTGMSTRKSEDPDDP